MVRVPLCRKPDGSHTFVPNHPFCDMLYRDLTRNVGTPRAMPEAQSTWTKRVGVEPNNKTHTVIKCQNQKNGNLRMTWTPPSVGNQGLITQDWKVHEPVIKTQQGKQNSVSKSKTQQGKENYIASQYRLIDPWTGPLPQRTGKARLQSVQTQHETQTDIPKPTLTWNEPR